MMLWIAIAGYIVANTISLLIAHVLHDSASGVIVGAIIGIWVGWLIFQQCKITETSQNNANQANNSNSLKSVIAAILSLVDLVFSGGIKAREAFMNIMPLPPNWLIGGTVVAVLVLFIHVSQCIGGPLYRVCITPGKLMQLKHDRIEREQKELAEWKQFKEEHNL